MHLTDHTLIKHYSCAIYRAISEAVKRVATTYLTLIRTGQALDQRFLPRSYGGEWVANYVLMGWGPWSTCRVLVEWGKRRCGGFGVWDGTMLRTSEWVWSQSLTARREPERKPWRLTGSATGTGTALFPYGIWSILLLFSPPISYIIATLPHSRLSVSLSTYVNIHIT